MIVDHSEYTVHTVKKTARMLRFSSIIAAVLIAVDVSAAPTASFPTCVGDIAGNILKLQLEEPIEPEEHVAEFRKVQSDIIGEIVVNSRMLDVATNGEELNREIRNFERVLEAKWDAWFKRLEPPLFDSIPDPASRKSIAEGWASRYVRFSKRLLESVWHTVEKDCFQSVPVYPEEEEEDYR